MKKLLAILLICALFVPTAVRQLTYVQCTLQVNDGQVCDCNMSSTPADQSSSLPDRQKEITEQTDLKFIVAQTAYTFSQRVIENTWSNYHPSFYTFAPVNTIFHPPGISHFIV